MNINELMDDIRAESLAAGWWDANLLDNDRRVCAQLIAVEIARATQGERDGSGTGEVRLVDALLRTITLGARFDLRYVEGASSRIEKTIRSANSTPARHFHITEALGHFGSLLYQHSWANDVIMSNAYSQLVDAILLTADLAGYDVETTTPQRLAHHKARADHTRRSTR